MRPFTKLLRDLWATRGRMAFMVLALAAGLTSMGGVLAIRGVAQREMVRNYLETVPASVVFDLGEQGLDDDLLKALRARPEVAAAERRATRTARWRRPGSKEWGRALLFIAEDFSDQRLALLIPERGERSPQADAVLVERSAMGVLDAGIGDRVELITEAGRPAIVQIAGVVHEPALAPAVQEQAGYFYGSPGLLARLGEPIVLNELRVLVADDPLDLASVDAQAETLGAWLVAQGVPVHEVRVPPPGRHPHQAPSEAILLLFAIFAGLIVLLAAILSASLLAITMARQVREIAVMKTLGASNGEIRRIYGLMVGIVAAAALVVSILPTWAIGHAGVRAISNLLNFDIVDASVPAWVFVVQVATGLALPMLAAAPAILGASRVSVREAMNDHGARIPGAGLERWVGSLENRVLQAGLRNALRVPRRLLLTISLLAFGGGLFVGTLSLTDAWEATIDQVLVTRHYDLELHLAEAVDSTAIAALGDVERVETWGFVPVTMASESGLPLSRTYPDGGHGLFQLVGAPADTELIDFKLKSGRWLLPTDRDAIVLNQGAAARLGANPIGQRFDMVIEGHNVSWQVIGVVEEVAAPATAYVTTTAFTERTGEPLRTIRMLTGAGDDPAQALAARLRIEAALAQANIRVASSIPLELLFNAMAEHVVVLIMTLLGLAMLMAIVSVLALASTMSTSVVERTREIGVMQATGARPVQVRRMVLIEGLFVTLLSLPFSLLIAVPLAVGVGEIVGRLSFGLPLPLDISWLAMAGWSVGVLCVAALGSLAPARVATKLTVREALGHV